MSDRPEDNTTVNALESAEFHFVANRCSTSKLPGRPFSSRNGRPIWSRGVFLIP